MRRYRVPLTPEASWSHCEAHLVGAVDAAAGRGHVEQSRAAAKQQVAAEVELREAAPETDLTCFELCQSAGLAVLRRALSSGRRWCRARRTYNMHV